MKRILIVDDHMLVRLGTKNVINRVTPHFEYYEASNKDEALKLLKQQQQLDLIILDVNIPDCSCDQLIEIARLKSPNSKIMILSMNSELLMARRFYKLGVDAYVSKSSSDNNIEAAFRKVLNNQKYFSEEMLEHLANEAFSSSKSFNNPFDVLTAREFEIMRYLFQGKNVQDIANMLSIHQSSVSTYKGRIFDKMKVGSVIELYDLFKLNYPE